MKKTNDKQHLDISFQYIFHSCVGDIEGMRYVQDISADILGRYEDDDKDFVIGKASIKIILIAQAIDDGYDIFEIFDSDSYTIRIGEEIFDFDNDEIKEDLRQALFGHDFMVNPNICIFERLTILPEYRGLGIAPKFIKDNYFFFSSTCGLIVMQPFPLQFEAENTLSKCSDFERQMGYEKMGQNEKKAKKSLIDFYKKVGFITAKGYNDLMFLVPAFKNEKLDAIDLNESIIV